MSSIPKRASIKRTCKNIKRRSSAPKTQSTSYQTRSAGRHQARETSCKSQKIRKVSNTKEVKTKNSNNDDDTPPDLGSLQKTKLYLEWIPKSIDRDELNLWIEYQIRELGWEDDDEVEVWSYFYEEVAYANTPFPHEDSYDSDDNEAEVVITNLGAVHSNDGALADLGVSKQQHSNDDTSSESGFRTQS